jgi:hypothetical protein
VLTISTSPVADDIGISFHALSLLRFLSALRLTPNNLPYCGEFREVVLQLVADGRLLAMTPLGSETGRRNCELPLQL